MEEYIKNLGAKLNVPNDKDLNKFRKSKFKFNKETKAAKIESNYKISECAASS